MFEALNNDNRVIRNGIDTDGMDFAPIKNYVGSKVRVDGFFFTESKYGKQVVVVGEGRLINMPKRAVESFEKIMNDEAMKNAVVNGKLALTDIKMADTKNGTTTVYKFTEV